LPVSMQIPVVVIYGLIALLVLLNAYVTVPGLVRWSWRWCQAHLRIRRQPRIDRRELHNVDKVDPAKLDARERQLLAAFSQAGSGPCRVVPMPHVRQINVEVR